VTPIAAVLLAGLAAALAGCGVVLFLAEPMSRAWSSLGAGVRAAERIVEGALAPLRRAGAEGRDVTSPERRRLQLAFAIGSLPIALMVVDPLPAAVLSGGAALLAPRAVVWRRERYTRRLGEGAAIAATRIADALASGHTTRAAITIAGRGLEGPIGQELSRVAVDLEVGATTDFALAAFRERAASRRVDLLVAALRLQRRSGGNLAGLLRDIATAVEDQSRLEAEARAETAQARFTSTVVLAMPFCVLGMGELAAPGMVGRMAGSALGAWLLGTAVAMQAGGAVLVRRLARVDP
jgi:tight adherence protein B